MAGGAESYQILRFVIAQLASRDDVVNLELLELPTKLAPPAVAFKHLSMQLAIGLRVKPKARFLGEEWCHAVVLIWSKNSPLYSAGRNLKSREIEKSKALGLPFSRLAPPRKSAQIISRQ